MTARPNLPAGLTVQTAMPEIVFAAPARPKAVLPVIPREQPVAAIPPAGLTGPTVIQATAFAVNVLLKTVLMAILPDWPTATAKPIRRAGPTVPERPAAAPSAVSVLPRPVQREAPVVM